MKLDRGETYTVHVKAGTSTVVLGRPLKFLGGGSTWQAFEDKSPQVDFYVFEDLMGDLVVVPWSDAVHVEQPS